MVEPRRNIFELEKVCSGNIENILYDGLQSHAQNHGHQPKYVVWWDIRVSGYESVQIDYWVIDISDEYKARYMLCCENLELVSSKTYMGSLDSRKACDEVPKRYDILFTILW